MSKNADLFTSGTPAGVKNVTRDAAGYLLQWVENGFTCTVTRDIATRNPIKLTAAGPAGRLTTTYEFVSGKLVGISGDRIATQMQREVIAPVVGLTSSQATALAADPSLQLLIAPAASMLSPAALAKTLLQPVPRTMRYMLAGASQHSRCSTEEQVVNCRVQNQVCTINLTPPNAPKTFDWMNGLLAFCAVSGCYVFGPITVTGATQITIPAPGYSDTELIIGGSDDFVHLTGHHTAASWAARIESDWGLSLQCVGNLSQHGAKTQDVQNRLPCLLAAIESQKPELLLPEVGWGNSCNAGEDFNVYFPQGLANLEKIQPLVPLMAMTTLPAPAPGTANSAQKIKEFNEINRFILNYLPRKYPNILVIDLNEPLLDRSSNPPVSIANVHSDQLHWMPQGADIINSGGYRPVLSKFLTYRDPFPSGASDVWANGGKQLFDGLLASTGTKSSGVANMNGVFDLTVGTITKQGAGSSILTGSVDVQSDGRAWQTLVFNPLTASAFITVPFIGLAGAEMFTRMQPGRRYRPAVLASISNISGTINAIQFVGRITFSGVANQAGPRLCWSGRNQNGYVESNNGQGTNNFRQTASELDKTYTGRDFVVPANASAITGFTMDCSVLSGAANSAVTVTVKRIGLFDVTDLYQP